MVTRRSFTFVSAVVIGALAATALVTAPGHPARADDARHPAASIVRSADGTSSTVRVDPMGATAAQAKVRELRGYAHSDLQPTGRFAAEGDELVVTLPGDAPAMTLRIGQYGAYAAHNDGKEVDITSTPLAPGRNVIAAPIDGMVSIEYSGSGDPQSVTVAGGDPVPVFVRGVTTERDFEAELDRYADAPFVTIVTERIAGVFQPSATGRHIRADDVTARTAYWDRVVELTNATYGLVDDGPGVSKKFPHRIHIASPDASSVYAYAATDRIAFPVGSGAAADLFRAPFDDQWGLWHEIGHTYEPPVMSFPGTSELIVNISPLAIQDALGYPSRWDSAGRHAALEDFFASEDRDWLSQNDTVKMMLWEQPRRAFGDTYLPRLFQELRVRAATMNIQDLDADDEHDLLVSVMGSVTDRDLRPFIDRLGFPAGDAVQAELAARPPLERPIWQNIDSRDRTVERILPAYAVPDGTVSGAPASAAVGQSPPDGVRVTDLRNTDGRGSAEVEQVRALADNRAPIEIQAVLRNDRDVRNVLATRVERTHGDAVVLLGQQNRELGDLVRDPDTGTLRFVRHTTWRAHTSWSGRPYVTVEVLTPDGRVVTSATLRGDQVSKALEDEFGTRRAGPGAVVRITHAQNDGIVLYHADQRLPLQLATTQAFRVTDRGFERLALDQVPACGECAPALTAPADVRVGTDLPVRVTGALPGEDVRVTGGAGTATVRADASGVADFLLPTADVRPGPLHVTATIASSAEPLGADVPLRAADDAGPLHATARDDVGAQRGADVVVPVEFRSDTAADPSGTLDVVAPAGTRFRDGTPELPAERRLPGGDWTPWPHGSLLDVTVDDTGRRLTGTLAPSRTDALPAGAEVRWSPQLSVAADAETTPVALEARLAGDDTSVRTTTLLRPFDPLTVRAGALDRTERTLAVSGTGTPGARVVVDGRRSTVDADGVWSTTMHLVPSGRILVEADQRLHGTVVDTARTSVDEVVPVTARVQSTSDVRRTATLRGTASPGSVVRVGGRHVTAGPLAGGWVLETEELPVGASTVRVVQEFNGDHVDHVDVPVTVLEGGAVHGTDGPPVAIQPQHEAGVAVLFRTTATVTRLAGTVTFTAPEGASFRATSAGLPLEYRKPGGSWTTSSTRLTAPELSADGRTLTYAISTASSFSLPTGTDLRLTPTVAVGTELSGSAAVTATLAATTSTSDVRAESATPIQLGQPITAVAGDPATLPRGATTDVEMRFRTQEDVTRITGTLTATAPAGTRFAPGQTVLAGAHREPGGAWTHVSTMDLTGGTVSQDGTTITFSLATGSSFSAPAGTEMRWLVGIAVPTDAAAGESALAYRLAGTATGPDSARRAVDAAA